MIEVLHQLYAHGIDCGLETYQGFGLVAWIVDAQNRRREKYFEVDDLDSVAQWLLSQACERRELQPHDLLSELARSARKPSKQVSTNERRERNASAPAATVDRHRSLTG
jgi:hypothetical protein